MGTLYALVLTIVMANGDYQEAVIGVFGSLRECETASSEQSSITNCYRVKDTPSGVSQLVEVDE
jgi:hypothetical protein